MQSQQLQSFEGLQSKGQVVLVSRADQCVLHLAVVPILGCKKHKKCCLKSKVAQCLLVVSHGKIPSNRLGFLIFGWVSISLIKWMWSSVGGSVQAQTPRLKTPILWSACRNTTSAWNCWKFTGKYKKKCGYQWKSFKGDLQRKKNACSATSCLWCWPPPLPPPNLVPL